MHFLRIVSWQISYNTLSCFFSNFKKNTKRHKTQKTHLVIFCPITSHIYQEMLAHLKITGLIFPHSVNFSFQNKRFSKRQQSQPIPEILSDLNQIRQHLLNTKYGKISWKSEREVIKTITSCGQSKVKLMKPRFKNLISKLI